MSNSMPRIPHKPFGETGDSFSYPVVCSYCGKPEEYCACYDDWNYDDWSDQDEANLEQFEIDRRRKIAERNEY